MSLPILPVDFSRRTILPAAVAVSCPPFTDADHQRSALVRDVLDTIELDRRMPPRPEPADVGVESIVMAGAVILNSYRRGSVVVSQSRSVAVVPEPELSIAEPTSPAAFEREPSLADDAAAALAAINNNCTSGRTRTAPARRVSTSRPRGTSSAARPAAGLGWGAWLVAGLCLVGMLVTLGMVLMR